MVTQRSCALDAIELCLDAQMAMSSLNSLRNVRRASEDSIKKAIDDAKKGWTAIKSGISKMEGCGIELVTDREVRDIDSNLINMSASGQFLDSDGPFVAAQISRLIRFEVLTSGGRPSRG